MTEPTQRRVVVLGAGAAGTAAARTLATHPGVSVSLVARTDETPSNRMLVNKGIAIDLLQPEQIALPIPGVELITDTAHAVSTVSAVSAATAGAESRHSVVLASGATLDADVVLIATGSAPRALPIEVPGATQAQQHGNITTLHSVADGVRVRDALAAGPSRIVVLGGGILAGETASLLAARSHEVTMVTRSAVPGAGAFGAAVAQRILELHRSRLDLRAGRSLSEVKASTSGAAGEVLVTLDDGSRIAADLMVVAHGTVPTGPAPWASGLEVDARLRVPGTPRVYAAGGVARHRHPLIGDWRIDHWADSAAQGEHAARSVLHDLGLGEDPGAYLPATMHATTIHGTSLTAAGITGPPAADRVVSLDPLVVVHEIEGIPVGVSGLDAAALVPDWLGRLHKPTS